MRLCGGEEDRDAGGGRGEKREEERGNGDANGGEKEELSPGADAAASEVAKDGLIEVYGEHGRRRWKAEGGGAVDMAK